MGKRASKDPAMGTSLGDLLYHKSVNRTDGPRQEDRILHLEQELKRLEEHKVLLEERCRLLEAAQGGLSDERERLEVRVKELQGERTAFVSSLLECAVQAMKREEFMEVPGLLRAVLIRDPENLKAMINLAVAYAELGFREKAVATLEGVLARCPDHEIAVKNLGILTNGA